MVTRLIKTRSLIFILFLSLISTMGCTHNQLKPELPNLTFQASLQENLGGEYLISLGVCNTGLGMFEGDDNFNGVVEVRDKNGDICTRAEIFQFQALEHGESVFPISWRGELLPGEYTLTWGAPAYGSTDVRFDVTEFDGLNIIYEEHNDQLDTK